MSDRFGLEPEDYEDDGPVTEPDEDDNSVEAVLPARSETMEGDDANMML